MSEWLESAIARGQDNQDWLAPKRAQALDALANTQWPTRKTEAWRYTPLKAVERSSAKALDSVSGLTPVAIPNVSAIELVFVNGQFDALQSTKALPTGLTVQLGQDLSADQQAEALRSFSNIKPERHLFGLVNDALAKDVLLVTVAEGIEIAEPLRISSLLSAGAESHTRVLVCLEKGAQLAVIEDVQSQGDSLSTAFVEYDVAAEASLEHYRFALQTGSNLTIGGSHFQLSDKSKMHSTIVGFGSELSRLDTDIIHAGEFADAKLNAMYLLDGKELFDLHATVEHAMPNGTTEE